MDSYLKNIRIKFDADKSSYKKVESDIQKLGELNLFSDKELKFLEDDLKEIAALSNDIAKIEDTLKTLSNVDNDAANRVRSQLQSELKKKQDELKKLQEKEPIDKVQLASDITSAVGDGFSSFGNSLSKSNTEFGKITGKFISGVGDTFTNFSKLLSGDFDSLNDILNSAVASVGKLLANGMDELKNILDFSRMSNEETRNLKLSYGFSSDQAYGYSKAMSALGFGSEEDLMYASKEELELFRQAFDKYSNKYNELYDNGTFQQMREFEVEWAEFKEDLKLEVVEFFMNNKDTIKTTLLALLEFSKFAIDALGKVVRWLNPDAGTSASQRAANTASVLNNYSKVNSTNVKIDNTFNNVNRSDQTWLANAGQMTYEQVIRALQ